MTADERTERGVERGVHDALLRHPDLATAIHGFNTPPADREAFADLSARILALVGGNPILASFPEFDTDTGRASFTLFTETLLVRAEAGFSPAAPSVSSAYAIARRSLQRLAVTSVAYPDGSRGRRGEVYAAEFTGESDAVLFPSPDGYHFSDRSVIELVKGLRADLAER